MFTPEQVENLLGIIDLQHIIFIATNIGTEVLSNTEIEVLQRAGVDLDQIETTPFEEMFRWGILSMSIGDKKSKETEYKQFKAFLRSGKALPLTKVENNALYVAQRRASNDLRGLGNRIKQFTNEVLIEADNKQRLAYEKVVKKETVKNIKNRGSISNLVSKLGHKTEDWARDFGRISDFVMHSAFEEGRAIQLKKQYGSDTKVYKKVFASACKKCNKLYLTKGQDSKPIVFKLSSLQANGNNIGRKVVDWKPVVGPTHPWCRCMLVHIDTNYEWDNETGDFTKPKQFKRRVKRNSRIKITVGDNTIKV